MKLTQFTDYSLRALMYLAIYSDRLCTVKEISDEFDISYNHMVKVVHSLSKNNYVQAKKGKGGGITLAHPAEDINLAEVVCALEPDLAIAECLSSDGGCRVTPVCALKDIFVNARDAFVAELRKHTLADVTVNKNDWQNIFMGA